MLPTNTAKKSSTRVRPAPQAIEALDVERERHEHAEERQHVEVLPERRLSFGDGNEVGKPRLESEQVGDDECRHAEARASVMT